MGSPCARMLGIVVFLVREAWHNLNDSVNIEVWKFKCRKFVNAVNVLPRPSSARYASAGIACNAPILTIVINVIEELRPCGQIFL